MIFCQNCDIRRSLWRSADGTPHTITIGFQTLEDGTVTIRDRDTTDQNRVNIDSLVKELGE